MVMFFAGGNISGRSLYPAVSLAVLSGKNWLGELLQYWIVQTYRRNLAACNEPCDHSKMRPVAMAPGADVSSVIAVLAEIRNIALDYVV